MKNSKTILIIVLGILAVALLAFFYLKPSKRAYNWNETYSPESKQPYGTLFIREMLASYASDGFVYNTKKPIHQLLDSASLSGKKSTYVFIGHSIHMDSVDILAMQKYIRMGNDAFIISPYLQHDVVGGFYEPECSRNIFTQNIDTLTISANFYHPAFKATRDYPFSFRINERDQPYDWAYLSKFLLCDSVESIVPLGYFNPEYVNFFKVQYGQGNLFIHTNPVLFTNYFMVNERNTEYASSVLSHSSGKSFIWDEFSKSSYSQSSRRNPFQNPLYYLMQQPSLQYAWWLMLALVLLYVLFAAKRRQRFIPVLEQKVNSSLAFLKMVSSLHFQHQDHGNMARKRMRHFLHIIRTKYSLSTHKIDKEFYKKLAAKSQVSEGEIEIIFDQYHVIEKFKDIDSLRLAALYNAIQNFYKKAK